MSTPPINRGIVYLITNRINGKKYVGQTTTHKPAFGRMPEYGIEHRFVEHVYTSRRNMKTMPKINMAIKEFGFEAFDIIELERCDLDVLNMREAVQIHAQNTLVPNGYNVQCQSFQVIHDNYENIEVCSINEAGEKHGTRLYIKYPNKVTRSRIDITGDSFDESLAKARARLADLDQSKIVYKHTIREITDSNANELWYPYVTFIESFNNCKITKICVCHNEVQNQIRLEIKYEGQSYARRKTFGSKKQDFKLTINIAMAVVSRLEELHKIKYITNNDKIKELVEVGNRQLKNSDTA